MYFYIFFNRAHRVPDVTRTLFFVLCSKLGACGPLCRVGLCGHNGATHAPPREWTAVNYLLGHGTGTSPHPVCPAPMGAGRAEEANWEPGPRWVRKTF